MVKCTMIQHSCMQTYLKRQIICEHSPACSTHLNTNIYTPEYKYIKKSIKRNVINIADGIRSVCERRL